MSDWNAIALGELVEVIDPHPSHRAPDEVEQGIPFIGIGDIDESGALIEGKGRMVSPLVYDDHFQRYQISGNTIGFGRVATIGKVINFQKPTSRYVVSPTMALLEPKKGVNRDFILHALKSDYVKEQIERLLTGSTRSSLGIELLRQLCVLVPSEAAQMKISALLNTVDEQISASLELQRKYTALQKGVMSDLFNRGIDPATGLLRPSISEAPELYRDTPIGSLPKEWDVLPASLICERVIDCKNRTPPERDEGFAVIKTFNIKDGELVFDTLTFTDRLSFDIWTARGVPSPGDIVITREAPVGESFLIEEDMPQLCLGQRTMLYRPDPNVIESDFMYFATRSPRFQKRLLDMAGGSTVGHVRVGDVKEMLFPIPSSVEQKAIAKNCTAINKKLRAEKAMLDKLKAHKAGLMRDLLTGKVPVSA